MKVLGITGGTGSGKTTLLGRVEARGGLVIDCDAVYHRLLQTDQALLNALSQRFPTAFENGAFNRKKLGKLVFENEVALQDLNAITHGFVLKEVDRCLDAARQAGRALAAVDAIALFESGLDARCDFTIAVMAPLEQRVKRLMAREGISEAYARLRITAQKPDVHFAKSVNFVLENSCPSADAFAALCDRFLDDFMGGKFDA